MSFVFLGGEGASRPTFFELVAADRLLPSLKAAIVYSLSVVSQRRPWAARLLEYEDEVVALLVGGLDWHSLCTNGATFSESLYGIRRSLSRDPSAPLSTADRLRALFVQVALPYIHSKCHTLYTRYTPQAGILGLALTRTHPLPTAPLPPGSPLPHHLRRYALLAFLALFPWVHAGVESAKFVYQALYMSQGQAYYSPFLHLLGQRLLRVSAQDLSAQEKAKQAAWQRSHEWAGRGGNPLTRWLRGVVAMGGSGLMNHSRNAIIVAVFGFKVIEWWFLSAEQKLSANRALRPPPPPPPPTPDKAGVGLPQDLSACPLCRRKRTNPALASVSGYVFCYPCLFGYVMEHGCCPVTRISASPEHVRKLYDESM